MKALFTHFAIALFQNSIFQNSEHLRVFQNLSFPDGDKKNYKINTLIKELDLIMDLFSITARVYREKPVLVVISHKINL